MPPSIFSSIPNIIVQTHTRGQQTGQCSCCDSSQRKWLTASREMRDETRQQQSHMFYSTRGTKDTPWKHSVYTLCVNEWILKSVDSWELVIRQRYENMCVSWSGWDGDRILPPPESNPCGSPGLTARTQTEKLKWNPEKKKERRMRYSPNHRRHQPV